MNRPPACLSILPEGVIRDIGSYLRKRDCLSFRKTARFAAHYLNDKWTFRRHIPRYDELRGVVGTVEKAKEGNGTQDKKGDDETGDGHDFAAAILRFEWCVIQYRPEMPRLEELIAERGRKSLEHWAHLAITERNFSMLQFLVDAMKEVEWGGSEVDEIPLLSVYKHWAMEAAQLEWMVGVRLIIDGLERGIEQVKGALNSSQIISGVMCEILSVATSEKDFPLVDFLFKVINRLAKRYEYDRAIDFRIEFWLAAYLKDLSSRIASGSHHEDILRRSILVARSVGILKGMGIPNVEHESGCILPVVRLFEPLDAACAAHILDLLIPIYEYSHLERAQTLMSILHAVTDEDEGLPYVGLVASVLHLLGGMRMNNIIPALEWWEEGLFRAVDNAMWLLYTKFKVDVNDVIWWNASYNPPSSTKARLLRLGPAAEPLQPLTFFSNITGMTLGDQLLLDQLHIWEDDWDCIQRFYPVSIRIRILIDAGWDVNLLRTRELIVRMVHGERYGPNSEWKQDVTDFCTMLLERGFDPAGGEGQLVRACLEIEKEDARRVILKAFKLEGASAKRRISVVGGKDSAGGLRSLASSECSEHPAVVARSEGGVEGEELGLSDKVSMGRTEIDIEAIATEHVGAGGGVQDGRERGAGSGEISQSPFLHAQQPGGYVNLFEAAAAAAHQQQQGSGASAGAEAGGATADLLRNNPQFQQMRQLIRTQPQLLQPLLPQLATTQPQLLQLINQNQDQFIQLLEEGDDGKEGGAAGGAQYLTVTPGEEVAIDQLEIEDASSQFVDQSAMTDSNVRVWSDDAGLGVVGDGGSGSSGDSFTLGRVVRSSPGGMDDGDGADQGLVSVLPVPIAGKRKQAEMDEENGEGANKRRFTQEFGNEQSTGRETKGKAVAGGGGGGGGGGGRDLAESDEVGVREDKDADEGVGGREVMGKKVMPFRSGRVMMGREGVESAGGEEGEDH
ncbi:hypothetical protein HDV00_000581 [Rhizophlyctis rosea]|nr:hypothetical protein HDV00_000581 [Rhizophlyctis rosea]